MTDLVRSDLPELLVIGARVRSLVARSPVAFALLAGIGANLIFSDLLRAVAFAVLDALRPERAPRPYDFQEILGPAAGLVVARFAGGIPGAFAYLGYSGIVLVLGLVGRMLTCAGLGSQHELGLGLISLCSFGPLDLLAGAAPLLVGLGIGSIAARSFGDSRRSGANPLLEAAGAHFLPSVVFAFGARALTYQGSPVFLQQVLLIAAPTVLAGVFAGTVAGIRSATPNRTAILLTALLVATWLYPLGASRFQMAAGADRLEIFLFALPLLDLVTIPLTAWYVGRRARHA